jgi:uncharacterized protein YkwD
MKKILPVRVLAGAVMATVVFSSLPASAMSSSSYETQVKERTNTKRVERDLVAVKHQSCIDGYAEKQAKWMASHGKLKHQDLGTILDACDLTGVSENIAYGYSSGNKVVSAWMKSPGHRANLLSKKMRYIGVGAVQDSDDTWWVSQVFGTRK